MEISGASATHSQAPSSSSVIVQSQSKSEEAGLSGDNKHQSQQSQQQQQQQQQHLHPHHSAGHHRSLPAHQAPSSSSTSSPVLSPPARTVGKNYNGTMVTTSTPSNEAELQLYRVLQRASLLMYYDTLLEMGGDDVQQLCDAGEEEFLEIMALVGMATKPLHVRRFQKSLAEWVNNPTAFQTPLSGIDSSRIAFSPEPATHSRSPFSTPQTFSPSSITGTANIGATFSTLTSLSTNLGSTLPATSSSSGGTPLQLSPSLTENQIARLTAAAERLAAQLENKQPRAQSAKKRSSKELEQIMNMAEDAPGRMDGIRKFSAIYGRFDCKRRPEKPLTLHEVCVNEAAAQICKYVPTLLTRRDELFPLARQIVRDSGFGHSAAIARYSMGQQIGTSSSHSTDDDMNEPKRMRTTDVTSDYTKEYSSSADEMRHNLLAIYQKLGKTFEMSDANRFSSNYSRSEYDEGDSRFSFSSSGSPQLQSSNGGDNDIDEENKGALNDISISPKRNNNDLILGNGNSSISGPHGVHVLSASGNHIIAVTNPALALSPALVDPINIKRETPDE